MRNIVVFALLISLVGGAEIQDLILVADGANTKLTVKADASFVANTFTLKDPARIVIDCSDVITDLVGKTYLVNRGGIKELSVTGFKEQPGFIRIVGKLDRDYSFLTTVEDNNFVVNLLTGLVSAFPAWQAATSVEVAVPVSEEIAPPVPTPKPAVTVTGRPISFDLEDADILTVLRALSEYAGVNIVAGKDVSGTVTVRLHNVPWRRALEIILKAAGYTYREDPGIIRVDTAENLDKQDYDLPVSSKIYKLEFADPSEMLGKIQAMLSPKGKANIDTRTNSVVVTEVQPVHDKIKQLVRLLDTPTPQVEIMAKVVDIDASASQGLGIDWTLRGLESRIVRADVSMNPVPTIAGYGIFNVGTVPSLAQVTAAINILEETGKGETISAPRVSAVDNRKASILGGQRFGIPTRDIAGNTVIQFYTVGTKLEVTPHINSLEEITMDIHAEVSELDRASALAGRPIITTSEADTKVLVKDGNTVVIGGFIRRKETQAVRGIPILKSIPILGALFRETTTTFEDRELLIFITPTIIRT
ncbi:MAG: AMIN domain-containing protein [candidate division WOR-3 bacterium]|nr:MAG: AMIN domain-containing protein [candidate division WOR-3 bacterium]